MGAVTGYLLGRNLAFRHAPGLANGLMRLTNVTGRGGDAEGDAALDYFEGVVEDYERIAAHAGVVEGDGHEPALFKGRTVLELGPGNTRAVAMLARLRGALSVDGYDAFDLQTRDPSRLRALYEGLLKRAGEPASKVDGLLTGGRVHHDAASLKGTGRRYDLVISRAVLEHVRDLTKLHRELRELTTADAVLIHKIDMRSHGFEWDHELDFLLFPEKLYRSLTTHIGEPNRVRAQGYLDVAMQYGFTPVHVSSTRRISPERVAALRDSLAEPYRSLSPEILSVLGIWLVLVREGHPLARAAKPVDLESIPVAPSGMAPF
jgi:SAM-dependent methyltransferase